ncbi:hypothetical protein AEM42_05555 [Betaproteobacteria bacterium UKL13-2]|jgi:cbb3-type cytochrome oxidase maturation protein|nr:hypothetical protein AEM42_05555 [Betaproteobacteria bacterium UKL13-2]HCG52375.1 cbb3-type cytochrome oxidase assembly protein CcoS [Betaproteobacteria bacterium]
MESIWILVPLSLLIAAGIGAIFWWAVSDGQMDDLDSPSRRILIDDDAVPGRGCDASSQHAETNNPSAP